MANEKISQMPAISSFATGDLLPIVDVSEISTSDQNKSVTFGELFRNVLGGSASAPSIAFTGDQNTGIYSPGADQVAISTNGTGRLFVDASGRILFNNSTARNIGSSVPSLFSAEIAQSGLLASFTRNSNDGTSAIVVLGKSRGTTVGGTTIVQNNDALGEIRFAAADGVDLETNASWIRGEVDGVPGADSIPGRILFSTNGGTANASPQERLRITSAGLVGIGASAPQDTLQVGADSTSHIAIANTGSTDVTSGIRWRYGSAGTVLSQILSAATGVGSNTYLSFHTSGTGERMRIDAIGRVGIGTTSPGHVLDITKNQEDETLVQVTNGGSTSAAVAGFRALGTGPKFADFKVNAALNLAQIYGGSIPSLYYDFDSHIWRTAAGSERARIDSSGRLLVGTSSSSNLYAIGGANFAPKVQIQGTDPIELGVQRTDGPPYVHIANGQSGLASGNDVGFISFNGKDSNNLLVQAAQISAAVDGTPGANDMPGRLVFSTTADGASSPTERMRITNGGVIGTFSAGTCLLVTTAAAANASTVNPFFIGQYGGTGYNTGTSSVFIFSNGNIVNTNNSYGAISDIKLKENIVDASSQWGDLKALQVRNYNFKEGQTHTQIGLVAQEAELVSPGLVTESPDRDAEGNDLGTVTKSVNYSVLYMKAVKALQEAMERIETLEAKVAALESA